MVIEYQQLAKEIGEAKIGPFRLIKVSLWMEYSPFRPSALFLLKRIHITLRTKSLWKCPFLMGLDKGFNSLPYSFHSHKTVYFHRYTRGLF